MKKVPDLLTASRGIIATVIVVLGLVGPRALEAVILLIILGWTTDILDGRFARRFNKQSTWIGEREFAFDMVMVFSGLCYLVMAGFVPVIPAVVYAGISAVFIIYFRSKAVTMSFACPVVALPLVVAYFHAPRAAALFVVWICLAIVFDWRRFKGVVLEFIQNTKALAKR